jgi:hypothetical protein
MRKLPGALTLSFIALLFHFVGCSKKPDEPVVVDPPAPVKFEALADLTTGTLEGKGSSLTLAFSREVADVSEAEGVKVTRDGSKVVFTQMADWPDEAKELKFVVKGEGEDHVPVTITLARKPAMDVVLETEAIEFALSDNSSASKSVAIRSGRCAIESVDNNHVKARIVEGRVFVKVEPTTPPGEYHVKIKSMEEKKGASLAVRVIPTSAAGAFALEHEGRLEVRFKPNAPADTEIVLKAKTGTIVGVRGSPEKSMVSWKLDPDRNAVVINVSKNATEKDAREYDIRVDGKNVAGKADRAILKFKLALETSFLLDDGGNLHVKLNPGAQKETRLSVKAVKGTIVGVSSAPERSKVTWKFDRDSKAIAITVAKDAAARDARIYEIKVDGKDEAGKPEKATIRFKLTVDSFALEGDGQLVARLDTSAANDTQIFVKAKSGTIVAVRGSPEKSKSKVTWDVDRDENAVAITIARDAAAGDAKEYHIIVEGKDGSGKLTVVPLKFKLAVPKDEPFVLEDNGGNLVVKVEANATKDVQMLVKAKSGAIVGAHAAPPDSKVTWKYDHDQRAIVITVPKNASGAEARDYVIKVDGKDGAGKRASASLKFKVTVAGFEPFALDDDGKLVVKVEPGAKNDTEVLVKARTGTIVGVRPSLEKSLVAWKFDRDRKAVVITVSKDATSKENKEHEIQVDGKDSAGKPAVIALKFMVRSAVEPFLLDDDGKLEVKVDPKANKDTQVWVKVKSGDFVILANESNNSNVTWKYDDEKKAIVITVSKEAGAEDAREYEIRVKGKNSAGKRETVTMKFRVTLAAAHAPYRVGQSFPARGRKNPPGYSGWAPGRNFLFFNFSLVNG